MFTMHEPPSSLFFFLIKKFLVLCMYVCGMCGVNAMVFVEVRGQLSGIGSFLQPFCAQGSLSTDHQVWQQVSFLTEPFISLGKRFRFGVGKLRIKV